MTVKKGSSQKYIRIPKPLWDAFTKVGKEFGFSAQATANIAFNQNFGRNEGEALHKVRESVKSHLTDLVIK